MQNNTRPVVRKTKRYIVYDKETGYILAGPEDVYGADTDGYNIFTRPYKHPTQSGELCRLDSVYNASIISGLPDLKKENLVIATMDETPCVASFVENPKHTKHSNEVRGWWRLTKVHAYAYH